MIRIIRETTDWNAWVPRRTYEVEEVPDPINPDTMSKKIAEMYKSGAMHPLSKEDREMLYNEVKEFMRSKREERDMSVFDYCKLSERTVKLMNSRSAFHFRRNHIFINFSFRVFSGAGFNLGSGFEHYIHPDHKVHIYLSYADFIDEYMHEYVENVGKVCNNKVTFHVSKRDRNEIVPVLHLRLGDLKNWEVITECNSVVTPYRRSDDEYLCIGYNYKPGLDRIKYSLYNESRKEIN